MNNKPAEQTSFEDLLAIIDNETIPFHARGLSDSDRKSLQDSGQKKLYISFLISEIELALPIESIQETGSLPPVIPLPAVPSWVLGICHIRGEIIPVFDLKSLFNFSVLSYRESHYFVLLKNQGRKFGFPVDRITGIAAAEQEKETRFAEHDSSPGSRDLSAYIKGTLGVNDRVLAILDAEKLMESPVLKI